MRRVMDRVGAAARTLAVFLTLAVVLGLGAPGFGGATAAEAKPLTIETRPLRLEPERLRGQPATFLSGLILTAPGEGEFGGLSGVLIDGARIRLVGDRGVWVRARLTRDRGAAITALVDAEIGPLRDRRDAALFGRRGDAESLAEDGAGGLWIGFEHSHRITGRKTLGGPALQEASQLPTQDLGRNSGIEGLALGPDGALWAIAETQVGGAGTGWRLKDGAAAPFRFDPIGLHKPTAADFGPDGALYVLERDFGVLRGVSMRIRRFAAPMAGAAAGDLGPGEILVDLDQRARIDNMEALSADAGPDGEVILTAISDDNFNEAQQTILLQFTVAPAAE